MSSRVRLANFPPGATTSLGCEHINNQLVNKGRRAVVVVVDFSFFFSASLFFFLFVQKRQGRLHLAQSTVVDRENSLMHLVRIISNLPLPCQGGKVRKCEIRSCIFGAAFV